MEQVGLMCLELQDVQDLSHVTWHPGAAWCGSDLAQDDVRLAHHPDVLDFSHVTWRYTASVPKSRGLVV